jgi:3-oxoacyl-[acyl-carrier-protein] synthase II
MKRRVVITGLGVVSPLGCDLEDVWVRVCNGESGIRAIEDDDFSHFRSRIGGKVLNWSCDGYLPVKEAKRLDRFAQFAVVAAIDAVKHSGLDTSREDPYRCGVIIGSGVGGLREIEVQHTRLLEKGPDKVSAFTIPKMMLNAASGHVSIQFGLRGPNAGVATACASASNAMADAVKAIQYGEAEVIITGGSEAAVTPMGMSAFCALRALSERNDDPARASRPFDKDRDGFVLSEGAGILVFEELEHAKQRRATIFAEMLGCGVSADGGHITQPDPNGIGAAKAMELALKDARISPADVDYINAHGTSTPLGDKAETQAIKSVFGENAKSVSVSSTKSQLGHSLGASGGIEMALSVLALNRGLAPPTINYETPDPDCDLDYTPNVPRERKINIVMSNSFGFGGHNVSLVAGSFRNGL